MSAALDYLAGRVATDPLFLACALAEFARSEGLNDAGLAARFGLTPDQLTQLKLCGAPRSSSFDTDIAAIAGRFGLDPNALASAVTLGQAVARLRAKTPVAGDRAAFLLAARDDDRAPPPPPPPPAEDAP